MRLAGFLPAALIVVALAAPVAASVFAMLHPTGAGGAPGRVRTGAAAAWVSVGAAVTVLGVGLVAGGFTADGHELDAGTALRVDALSAVMLILIGAVAPTGVRTDDQQVVLIGRAIGASIATGVWLYFSSLAVLTGAELNSVLLRLRVRARAAEAVTSAGEAVTSVAEATAAQPPIVAAAPGRFRPAGLPRVIGVRAAAIGHWLEGRSR